MHLWSLDSGQVFQPSDRSFMKLLVKTDRLYVWREGRISYKIQVLSLLVFPFYCDTMKRMENKT